MSEAGKREALELDARTSTLSDVLSSFVHEINNPLAAVVSNLAMAIETAAELPESAQSLELLEILADCKTAIDATSAHVVTVRSLTRFEPTKIDVVPIEPTVHAVMGLARHYVHRRAKHEVRLEPGLAVRLSPSLLVHVLLDLVIGVVRVVPAGSNGHRFTLDVRGASATQARLTLTLEGPLVGTRAEARYAPGAFAEAHAQELGGELTASVAEGRIEVTLDLAR